MSLTAKRTRKREFLAQMDHVVPWAALVELIAPYAPEGKKGRLPFAVQTMLRIHFMQQWLTLSDPAMEEALHDIASFREFASLGWDCRLPDESTILRFRHLLEQHKLANQILALVNDLLSTKGLLLKAGTVVDATLIAAPSSTKNRGGQRDPEMHQSKKGNQWFFGMKAHIGVDADSGLVHTVRGNPMDALVDKVEKLKASVRAKVEHPFRVIKRQFGYVKVRKTATASRVCAWKGIVWDLWDIFESAPAPHQRGATP